MATGEGFPYKFLLHIGRRTVLFSCTSQRMRHFCFTGSRTRSASPGCSFYSFHQLNTYFVLPLPNVSVLTVVSNGNPSGISLTCERMFFISSLLVKNFFGSPFSSMATIQRSSPCSVLMPISKSFTTIGKFTSPGCLPPRRGIAFCRLRAYKRRSSL